MISRTPHEGDPLRARDQKHIVEQLRGLELIDTTSGEDILTPQWEIIGGKVIVDGVRNVNDNVYAGFAGSGGPPPDTNVRQFISHLVIKQCPLAGASIVFGPDLYIKATASPESAFMGYESIVDGNVIGWLPGDGTEAVPGTEQQGGESDEDYAIRQPSGVRYYDGYLVPNAGLNGASMTARLAHGA